MSHELREKLAFLSRIFEEIERELVQRNRIFKVYANIASLVVYAASNYLLWSIFNFPYLKPVCKGASISARCDRNTLGNTGIKSFVVVCNSSTTSS